MLLNSDNSVILAKTYLAKTYQNILRRWTSAALILMYHRIAEVASDPWGLCVSQERFERQLAVLRKCGFSFTSLDRILQPARFAGTKSVAVTFDDGYVDNFINARPILESYQVPATFFIVSGAVESREEFWWDHLERLILEPPSLPRTIEYTLSEQRFFWSLDRIAMKDETARRLTLYADLWEALSRLSPLTRSTALAQLAAQTGNPPARIDYLPMTRDQLRKLACNPLFNVGAHSVTHPMLANLSVAEQHYEIEGSKTALEDILKRPVDAFSCPHGSYSHEMVDIFVSAGLRFVCTSDHAAVDLNTDALKLPRIVVGNWDTDEFEKRLSRGWS